MSRPTRSAPWHPRANTSAGTKTAWVFEHILVAEAALGKFLPDGACVHHVDEDKCNNANTNLVICQDNAYHKLLHARARVVRAGGDPNTQRLCGRCGLVLPIQSFNKNQRRCRTCQSESFRAWWRKETA